MQFSPYHLLGGRPNVIVDGAPAAGTTLTLSHWPRSGTPWQLKADTSAAIVLRFLRLSLGRQQELVLDAELVSNNHFDEDGLLGLWSLLHPDQALRWAPLIEEVARAGDFCCTGHGDAARIAFALATLADSERSPLAAVRATGAQPQADEVRYRLLLEQLPGLLADVGQVRALWAEAWCAYQASLRALECGSARLEEFPELDLVVVEASEPLHPMAIYNHTDCLRVLESIGATARLHYRYETWVQLVSRPVQPRLDLGPLAARLQQGERERCRWCFDGVDATTPQLVPRDQHGAVAATSWRLDRLLPVTLAWLREAALDPNLVYNPFDASSGS
ncbi:MAG TPA: DUF6687 family protein [Acidobacteriota bacterium]